MAEDTATEPTVLAANERIRDAAKWLITSSAAVGVVLLAGSQLSNLGKLDTCLDLTQQCLRLPIAGLSAVLGLAAVVYAIWKAVKLLLPVAITIDELSAAWNKPNPPQEVEFFKNNPTYLGAGSPQELSKQRNDAWEAKQTADRKVEEASSESERKLAEERAKAAQLVFADLDSRVGAVTDIAQHQRLRADFSALLPHLVGAAIVGALGIVTFAWASNPPAPPSITADLSEADLTGADLRGTDLRNADLTEADLSDADLEGADLRGAKLKDVVWSDTTCPDGSSSSDHHDTCSGHLESGDS